jgi:hypothetical protein
MSPQERAEFDRLKRQVEQMVKAQDVPFIESLNRRLDIGANASSKTAASATRSVNEAGASSYSVMFPPTGFINIGGFNVPYIN